MDKIDMSPKQESAFLNSDKVRHVDFHYTTFCKRRKIARVNLQGLSADERDFVKAYFLYMESKQRQQRAIFSKIEREIAAGSAHKSDMVLFDKVKKIADPIAKLLIAHHGLDSKSSSLCNFPIAIISRNELLDIFEQNCKNSNVRESFGELALSVFFDLNKAIRVDKFEFSMARFSERLDYLDA